MHYHLGQIKERVSNSSFDDGNDGFGINLLTGLDLNLLNHPAYRGHYWHLHLHRLKGGDLVVLVDPLYPIFRNRYNI